MPCICVSSNSNIKLTFCIFFCFLVQLCFSFQLKTRHDGLSNDASLHASADSFTSNISPAVLKKDLENELKLDSSDIRSYAWFHGSLPRDISTSMVEDDGDFLIRESLSSPGEFVLTVKWVFKHTNCGLWPCYSWVGRAKTLTRHCNFVPATVRKISNISSCKGTSFVHCVLLF